jgi:predicted dehydrogenase
MNIVIIGAGNLGRRHLQSLMHVNHAINVFVFDPSEDAVRLAQEAVNSLNKESLPKVVYTTDLDVIPAEVFLSIIATSSIHRKSAVQQLLQQSKVKNLVLEKFLFTRLADFAAVETLLQEHGVQCWVNCPRRMFPYYRELSQQIEGPVNLRVSGSNWGLACNSIHFLDLHYFLSGNSDLTYEVDNSKVIDNIFASKREGYTEFMGTLSLWGSDGSSVIMSCTEEGNVPLTVNLESASHKLYIHEGGGKMMAGDRADNWDWKWEGFKAPYQSQLTAEFVEQIISTGTCELPEYSVSAALHETLLGGWISKSRLITATTTIDECIIT